MSRAVPIYLSLVVFVAPALADERATTITVAGMAGAFERSHQELGAPEGVVGPRVTLGFEHAPLAIPAARGYDVAGALVPELFAGAFVEHDRAEGFVGAGIRAELKLAQREMGLFRVSARGAAYVAARGMVLGDRRDAMGEIAVGDYLFVGRGRTRIGVEGSVVFGRSDQMDEYRPRHNVGAIVQFYVGWAP